MRGGTGAGPTAEPRRAGPADAERLTLLERDANLVALRHVFDPAVHAYPFAAVYERWRGLLTRPEVVVEVVGVVDGVDGPTVGEPGLAAVLAHDERRVRHLAVHPTHWGRGLAGALLERAERRIAAGGERPVLWCLVDNHRARGLYEHRGWVPTGAERPAEFAPYPTEMEYAR